MCQFQKKSLSKIVVLVFLLASVIQSINAESSSVSLEHNTTTDKALSLINNVLPLDISQYNVSLFSYKKMPVNTTEEYVTYKLSHNGEEVNIQCSFKDGRLFTLIATALNGSKLIFAEPKLDTATLTKDILTKYREFTGDDRLSDMVNLLDKNTVDSINSTITEGNLELEVTNDSRGTNFYWKHVFSGCVYDEISIYFQSERRFLMGDSQSRFKMGNTEVRITEEQAIDIAMSYVKNYSYEATGGNGEKIFVSGFNVSRETATAELRPAPRDGLLYPTWRVEVPLLGLYPGHPVAFSVTIWADSGNFVGLARQAVGADYTTDNGSSNTNPTSASMSNDSSLNALLKENSYLLIGVGSTVGLIIMAFVVLLKKRKYL
jgi:hypothetical protein